MKTKDRLKELKSLEGSLNNLVESLLPYEGYNSPSIRADLKQRAGEIGYIKKQVDDTVTKILNKIYAKVNQ